MGGNLESFTRMDGAWLSGIDIAIKTACTARLFDMATEELGPVVRPGQPRYDIEPSNGGLRLSRHLDDRVEAGEPATRVRAV